jgi:hypothetical protein
MTGVTPRCHLDGPSRNPVIVAADFADGSGRKRWRNRAQRPAFNFRFVPASIFSMERKFNPALPDAYHPASLLDNATSVAGTRCPAGVLKQRNGTLDAGSHSRAGTREDGGASAQMPAPITSEPAVEPQINADTGEVQSGNRNTRQVTSRHSDRRLAIRI